MGSTGRSILGDEWPLVARDRQLRAIVTAAKATGGAGALVLSGGPGVGKTRLAREAMASLASAGRVTEWVCATRSASVIPFGALLHLLPAEDQFRVDRLAALRRLADRFVGMGDGRGVPVMIVDDAHLLDEPSATVVHHLVSRALAFVIATVRTGELCPDAVTSLWKDGAVRRVELFPLPDAAMETLLDHAFRDRLDTISKRQLCTVSGGNPLLLRETLLAGLETGALRRRGGIWQWNGAIRPTSRLVEVVHAQFGTTRDQVTSVLEVIACGEPLPLAVLERLADTDAITAAERTGLMVIESSGSRRFSRLAHPLYAEVIRSTMPRSRTGTIAGRIAAVVTTMPLRRKDDALRAGVWQLRAGQPEDPEILLAAAKQALDRLDLELAERLAKAASDAGGGYRADHLLARILNNHGKYEESVRALPATPEPVTGAIVRADMLYWQRGDVAEAERALDNAASTRGHEVDGNRCLILLFDSRCREALRVGQAVLRSPDAEPQAQVWAAAGATAAAGILGLHQRAAVIYRHGLAIAAAQRHAVPWGALQIGGGYCIGLLAGGRLDQAWELIERGYAAAMSEDNIPEEGAALVGAWAGFRGAIAKARGDLSVAATALRESLLLLAGFDTFRVTALGLAELAGIRALAGDDRLANRLLIRAEQPDRRPSRLFVPWIELNRGWTLAARGDISAAAAHARHAATLARTYCQPTVEAWALYDAARLGDARAVRARLAALATEQRAPVVSAFADAATALAVDDADRLVAAGSVFGDLGMLLHAAEAMAAAAGLFAARGQRSAGNAAALRAKLFTDRCREARTPLLDTVDLRMSLTRREREVAQLAADGRTSRQIAARLSLSIRTVDNYLGRVYTKLGVSGRAELAAAIQGS
jgi:DNA-binding CsgD family transcriptional regulator